MASGQKLSIIIPAYNEQATIAEIISRIQDVSLPGGLCKELVVIDDGSTDGTADALKPFHGMPGVVIVHQSNQGKTAALLTGFKNASGDILLIQDADLEYDPAQYPVLLTPILEGRAQVVYGSRFLGRIQGMAVVNRVANVISNWTFRRLYGVRITDINTCYKVFTRGAIQGMDIVANNFAFETEVTVKLLRRNFTIQEVPINYVARSRQSGKKITWATALEMFWPIIRYRFFIKDVS